MIAVTLKGLAGRKLRAALTALAIVLGVAMVSGTYVLTDTISKGFDAIFADTYTHADAVIVGQEGFGEDEEVATESYPAGVLAKVRALPQVEDAEGAVLDEARLVGEDGKVIESSWGTAAFSVDPAADPRFNPLTVVQGSWPRGGEQIAIDRATARSRAWSRATRSASARSVPCGSSASRASSSTGRSSRSGARRSPPSSWAPPSGCSTRPESSTRSRCGRARASPRGS